MGNIAAPAAFQAPVAASSTVGHTRAPQLFALGLFLAACLFSAYAYLDCTTHGPPIRADGYGYYAYLPAAFVDGNLSMKTPKAFRWTVVGKNPLPYEWDGISLYVPTRKFLDKYTIGTALLQSPFFLAAAMSARVLGYPVDGYSLPFQIAIQLSGMFYLAAGAFILVRYLLWLFRESSGWFGGIIAGKGFLALGFRRFEGCWNLA